MAPEGGILREGEPSTFLTSNRLTARQAESTLRHRWESLMAVDVELIVRILGSARGKPLTAEDVVHRGGLDEGQVPAVRRALKALVNEGRLEKKGSRWTLAPQPVVKETPAETKSLGGDLVPFARRIEKASSGRLIGTLTRHPDGYGFIASLHGGEDGFVPPQAMGDALDGDLVEARMGPGRDGRPVAKELKIIERRRRFAVGVYRSPQARGEAYVEPRDRAYGDFIAVRPTRLAQDGEVVRVSLESVERGVASGTVVARIGLPGEPDVEVLSVAYGEGFADQFPPDAVRAAKETPAEVRAEDKEGRRDLTGLGLVTIDGEDARDFDDAVFVERKGRGWRLVVAIADVTHYVAAGGALDKEAFHRATSVYFPRHVMPMLPEQLSNGICSLNPHVERLCMVADMTMSAEGRLVDTELYAGVMKSHARCTYTQVAALLEGQPVPELGEQSPMLLEAGKLAKVLTKARMTRGAIDFDMPESAIILDEEGRPAAVERRPRNAAHRLIEEFMLAANEAVATFFEKRLLPTVYRVHAEPDERKLEAFVNFARAFGHDIDADEAGKVTAGEINAFLHRVEGRPEQRALNHLLLRAMMQAVYSAENIGHFGLAAPSYLHFTSPIRRYPDLVVHRLLKRHFARDGAAMPAHEREAEEEALESTAIHCSERERAATNAEREIDAYYAATFMVGREGERFKGVIAGVSEHGLFVELLDPWVEGMVRAETIGSNARFDEEKHRLVYGGQRAYGIGDGVEVELLQANPITRRIDLLLVEKDRTLRAPPAGPGSRERRDTRTEKKPKDGKPPGAAKKPRRKYGHR